MSRSTIIQLTIYFILVIGSIYIGKLDKRITIGKTVFLVSVPLGTLTAICIIILFPIWLAVIGAIFLFLSKLKIFVTIKVAGLLASIGGFMIGIATGPIGWIGALVCVFVIVVCIRGAFLELYKWCFNSLSNILLSIRRNCDKIRKKIPVVKPIVFCVEFFLVCGLAIRGYWELLDWCDKKIGVENPVILYRIIACVPLSFLLFRSYWRDTTFPNKPSDGIDIPFSEIDPLIKSI